MDQHLVVHARVGHGRLGLLHARHHARQHPQPAHVAHLLQLHRKIVEVELALLEVARELLGVLFLDRRGGPLDEADNVAHAEDAVGDRAGAEGLDRVELLAGAGKLDRLAGDRAHRQRRAAAGIAVHAGEHNAGERDFIAEILRDVNRVLPGQAVDHQQHFIGGRHAGDGLHLGHQRVIDMQAARRVEQQDVEILEPRGFHRPARDVDRLLTGDDRQSGDLDLPAQHRQLLLRGRTVDVERGHQRLLAVAFADQFRQLGGGGGLARALQADHHDHDRGLGIELEAFDLHPAQRLDQLVVDDLDDHLAGGDRLQDILTNGLLGDGVDEAAGDGERDVGFEQRDPHFAHGIAHVLLTQRAAALELVEHPAKAVGQRIEHRQLLHPGAETTGKMRKTPADETSSASVAEGVP